MCNQREKTLDHLYSTHRDAYKALPCPPFGKSDQNYILLILADKLASVFTDIFNLFLSESVIPTCFKQTTIWPVPKNTKVTCLND